MQGSLFRSVLDKVPEITEVGLLLKTIKEQNEIITLAGRNLLQEKGKDAFRIFKVKQLSAACFSCELNGGHGAKNIVDYNGIACLDYDGIDDAEALKQLIASDPLTYATWISPSGNGVKGLIRTNATIEQHTAAYHQLSKHFEKITGIVADKQCSDPVRLCFLSHDAGIIINEDAAIFEVQPAETSKLSDFTMELEGYANSTNKDTALLESIVEAVESEKIDVTSNYDDWIKIGFIIADVMGESGRIYFHRLSKFNSGYDRNKCNEQYAACMTSKNSEKGAAKVGVGTLIHICEQNGVKLSKCSDPDTEQIDRLRYEFPVAVFPSKIQELINSANKSLNFPNDYTAAGILFAASVSIGNTHKIEVKKGWTESTTCYFALVGKPGQNKSHPLAKMILPLQERDMKNYLLYKEACNAQKENYGQRSATPILKQILVSDATPEALHDVHSKNPRGIGVCRDELSSWLSFDKYKKGNGSEEQMWLSFWSNKSEKINRVGTQPKMISSPSISVIGTIQPGVLSSVFQGGKAVNGFSDRVLFFAPLQTAKPQWTEEELNAQLMDEYRSGICKLLDLTDVDEEGNPFSKILKMDAESKEFSIKWFNQQQDIIETTGDTVESKFVSYYYRFCLILQFLHHAYGNEDISTIKLKSAQGAATLVEYFRNTRRKVITDITVPIVPTGTTIKEQAVYYSQQGLSIREIGKRLGKAPATIHDWLKKSFK